MAQVLETVSTIWLFFFDSSSKNHFLVAKPMLREQIAMSNPKINFYRIDHAMLNPNARIFKQPFYEVNAKETIFVQ